MGHIKQFSFKELCELDGGRIAIAIDQALKRAAIDCEDRPAEDRARKINLQIELVPHLDPDGLCESVKAQCQVKESVPTRKSRVYGFGLRKGGMLTFNPDSLETHNQDTFDFSEDDT